MTTIDCLLGTECIPPSADANIKHQSHLKELAFELFICWFIFDLFNDTAAEIL
jgi:hypothetical protein